MEIMIINKNEEIVLFFDDLLDVVASQVEDYIAEEFDSASEYEADDFLVLRKENQSCWIECTFKVVSSKTRVRLNPFK